MEKTNSMSDERVSDLVDGHTPDNASAQAFDILLGDSQAMQTWHAYHVIGDVLRSAELAPTRSDQQFLERLQQRLAQEPARPMAVETAQRMAAPVALPSANDAVFRWKLVAGVASFALVGVVGLGLWTQTTGADGDAQRVAQNAAVPVAPIAVVAADTDAGTMLRDARLDELMAAHRQLGGHSALQMPAGFLRNATYEGPAR